METLISIKPTTDNFPESITNCFYPVGDLQFDYHEMLNILEHNNYIFYEIVYRESIAPIKSINNGRQVTIFLAVHDSELHTDEYIFQKAVKSLYKNNFMNILNSLVKSKIKDLLLS